MSDAKSTPRAEVTPRGVPRLYIDRHGSGGFAKWAKYEYGCDRCDWWGFESSLLKILWRVLRHNHKRSDR